jgi:hypothetical protein
MAEPEHFDDPRVKSHPNFASVAQKELVLFSREAQLGSGKTCTKSVGDAVAEGIVNNETLRYFKAMAFQYGPAMKAVRALPFLKHSSRLTEMRLGYFFTLRNDVEPEVISMPLDDMKEVKNRCQELHKETFSFFAGCALCTILLYAVSRLFPYILFLSF